MSANDTLAAMTEDGIPVFKRGPWRGYRAHVRFPDGSRTFATLREWATDRGPSTPTEVRYRHPEDLRGYCCPWTDRQLAEFGLTASEEASHAG